MSGSWLLPAKNEIYLLNWNIFKRKQIQFDNQQWTTFSIGVHIRPILRFGDSDMHTHVSMTCLDFAGVIVSSDFYFFVQLIADGECCVDENQLEMR